MTRHVRDLRAGRACGLHSTNDMRDLEDPNDPQASCLAPGAHVGSYRVERVLAEGGMCVAT